MLSSKIFDQAEECIVPQQSARNSALTIICHKNGGKRLRISKAIMKDVLAGVTKVGVKAESQYIIFYEKPDGYPVQREGKEHDGAGVVYNGALVDLLKEKLSLDFNGENSLHFYDWEAFDDRKAVAIKVA